MMGSFKDSPWNLRICGDIKQDTHTRNNFLPLVIQSSHNFLLPHITCIGKVILGCNATTMCLITAKTAASFSWVVDIPFPIHDQVGTGSNHSRHHTTTEHIKPAIRTINPTPSMISIIVELPIDSKVMLLIIGLVKVLLIGAAEHNRIFAHHQDGKENPQKYFIHVNIIVQIKLMNLDSTATSELWEDTTDNYQLKTQYDGETLLIELNTQDRCFKAQYKSECQEELFSAFDCLSDVYQLVKDPMNCAVDHLEGTLYFQLDDGLKSKRVPLLLPPAKVDRTELLEINFRRLSRKNDTLQQSLDLIQQELKTKNHFYDRVSKLESTINKLLAQKPQTGELEAKMNVVIKSMEKQIQSSRSQIISIMGKQLLQYMQKCIREESADIHKKVDNRLEVCENSIKNWKQEYLINVEEEMGNIRKQIEQTMEKMEDLVEEIQPILLSRTIEKIIEKQQQISVEENIVDTIGPNGQFFNIVGRQIQRNGKSNGYCKQILLTTTLKNDAICVFHTYIKKTTSRHISIGIVDRLNQRQKQYSGDSGHAVSYEGYDGIIWYGGLLQGKYKIGGGGFHEGQVVTTTINMISGEIRWSVENNERACITLPMVLEKGREFVPYWQMWDEQDTIEWQLE